MSDSFSMSENIENSGLENTQNLKQDEQGTKDTKIESGPSFDNGDNILDEVQKDNQYSEEESSINALDDERKDESIKTQEQEIEKNTRSQEELTEDGPKNEQEVHQEEDSQSQGEEIKSNSDDSDGPLGDDPETPEVQQEEDSQSQGEEIKSNSDDSDGPSGDDSETPKGQQAEGSQSQGEAESNSDDSDGPSGDDPETPEVQQGEDSQSQEEEAESNSDDSDGPSGDDSETPKGQQAEGSQEEQKENKSEETNEDEEFEDEDIDALALMGTAKTLFEKLKEAIANAKTDGTETTIKLEPGRYDFTETLVISDKRNIKLITNEDDEEVVFTRGKKEDGNPFEGWLVTVNGGSKLTIGHQNKPYEFDTEIVTFEEAKKPINTHEDNKGKLPEHLIQEGETIYDAFEVEKKSINNKEEVKFSNNNIIFDGRLFGEEPIKVDSGLIRVSGELILNGGEIRYNATKNNYTNSGSYHGTINVYGKMTINDGRIHNNNMGYGKVTPYRPSGIYVVSQGTLIMNGGSIDENSGGSGVTIGAYGAGLNSSLYGEPRLSRFIMNGGEIHHNKANRWQQEEGGGVYILENAEFIMNDGEIHHNEASRGGGVAANSEYINRTDGMTYSSTYTKQQKKYHDYYPARFVMLGGKIHNNYAKGGYGLAGSGGGVYVNTDRVHLYSGEITDNKADNMGGGIYVSQVPIHLVLKDAIVTGNKAVVGDIYTFPPGKGGGFWECPSGVTHVYFDRTVYLHENIASSSGDDFYAFDKEFDFKMNNKKVGNTFYVKLNRYDEFLNRIKYITDHSKLEGKAGVEFNDMNPVDYLISLKFLYDEETIENIFEDKLNKIPSDKYFLIKNNTAGKGGGIGSNANVIFGEPGDSFEVEIEKQWFDETREKLYNSHGKIKNLEVSVDLYYGDIKEGKKEFITKVDLNFNNGFKVLLTELPAELSKKYKNPTVEVVEKPIEGWKLLENNVDRMSAGIRIFKPWTWSKSIGIDQFTWKNYFFEGDNLSWHYRDHQNNWDKGLDTEIEFKLHLIDKDGNKRIKTVKQVADESTKIGYDSNWIINFDFHEFIDDDFKINSNNLSVEFYYPEEELFSSKEEYLKHTLQFPLYVEGKIPTLEDVSQGRFLNYDNIFHFYLEEKEDGKYILRLPKIGVYSYGLTGDDYLSVENQLIADFKGKAGKERFTVTLKNYEAYQFKVKKGFTGFKPEEMPESLKVYVTSKGERIKDENGNDIYIILNKENGWTGIFDNLEPVEEPRKVYGIEEENKNYITSIDKIYRDHKFSAFYNINFWEENPEIPNIPVTILYSPYRGAPDSEIKVLYRGAFEYRDRQLRVDADLPMDKLDEDIVTHFFDKSFIGDDDKKKLELLPGTNTILIESAYFYWDTGTVWDSYNVYFSSFKDEEGKELNIFDFNIITRGKGYEKLVFNNTMPRTDIDVEKTWESSPEDEVKVYLGRKTENGTERLKDENGKEIFLILNEENQYFGSFNDLPLVDTKGELIEYVVEEEFLHGYYPLYKKVIVNEYVYTNPKNTDLYIKNIDEKLIYKDKGVLDTENLNKLDQFNVKEHIELLKKELKIPKDSKLTFGGLEFTFDRSNHKYIERYGDGSPKAYIINYEIKEDGKVYYTLPVGLSVTGLEDHNVHNLPASDLTITKEVISKNPEDFERLFKFLVELEHESIDKNRPFKIEKGLFEDYDFEEIDLSNIENFEEWFIGEILELKDGEYVRIINIPLETKYEVLELDNEEFIVRSINASGIIGEGENLVKFINERPDNPPEIPEVPEEPESPPEEPEIPEEPEEPESLPEEPEIPEIPEPEEPESPPEEPYNPKVAPKTFDPGIGIYVLIGIFSLVGFILLKKEYN